MAIRSISQAWKDFLANPTTFQADGGHLERFYIDFRQKVYPPLDDSTLSFDLNDSADNQTGSHQLAAAGYASYLLPMHPDDTWTICIRLKPTCSYYDTDQKVWRWGDASTYLWIGFDDGEFVATWCVNGGAPVEIRGSTTFSDDETLQGWRDLTVSFDLSANTGRMWLDSAEEATAWSGAPDALGDEKLPIAYLNESTGFEIAYIRLFRGELATTTVVSNRFRTWLAEEIHFPLDGHGLGRTRCNVTDKVMGYTLTREAEKEQTAYPCANSLELELNNRNGIFSDDQYAAFDAELRQYNGTSSQRYLQRRCPVMAESWYGNLVEPFFVGRITESLFSRETQLAESIVSVKAEDFPADMARAEEFGNLTYEDKPFADADESESLIHITGRLGTVGKVENYLGNSSFENATIANSWAVSGTGATLTRASGGLIGSYEGQLAYGSADAEAAQTIEFTDRTALNKTEAYVFAIYVKAADNATVDVVIEERDSGGVNDSSTESYSIVGGAGWTKIYIAHTVTDADSDRLKVRVVLKTNTTLSLDCAMLHRGTEPVDWFVLNSTDGSSAIMSADSLEVGEYDTIGFDVDSVDLEHPWAVVEQPWDAMVDLADATAAYYLGADASGTLRYRTPLATGYTDPTPLETLSSTWELATEIDELPPNWISVAGVKIIKDTAIREVWNSMDSDIGKFIGATLIDGAYYPDPDTYSDFWAAYEDIVITARKTRKWWQWHSRTRYTRVTRNEKDIEIVGVKSPSIVYNCTRPFSMIAWNPSQQSLTQILFDTTTYADKAQFKLRNDNGFTVVVLGSTIRGLLVRRGSGSQGYLHDKHIDRDAIRRDGETKLEVENNFIISEEHCARLADYLWKDASPKKHKYELPLPGAALYMEPGDWYTLQIGGAGQNEYVNSKVRLMRLVVSRGCREQGESEIEVREVQENWKYDSSAFAREVASGRYDGGRSGAIVVASSKFMGPASKYCDGTNDEVEIIAACQEAVGSGRAVQLTPGTFNTAAKVAIPSGVTLIGCGESTVIKSTGDEDIVEYEEDGSGIILDSLKLENGETVNYTKLAVNFNGAMRSILQRCLIVFLAGSGIMCDGNYNKLIDNTAWGGKPVNPYSTLDTEIFYDGAISGIRVSRLTDTSAVVVYIRGGAGKARVVQVADGELVVGDDYDEYEFDASASQIGRVIALDSTHFALTYSASPATGVYAIVGEVSYDDEIAFGSSVTVDADADDPVSRVCTLSSSAFIVAFRDAGDSSDGKCIVCTVSGTAITVGDLAYTFETDIISAISIAAISSSQFIVIYRNSTNAAVEGVIGTVEYTDEISYGTTATIDADGVPTSTSVEVLDSGRAIVGWDKVTSGYGTLAVVTISGTSISAVGDEATFNAGDTNIIDCDMIDENTIAVTYRDDADSDHGKLIRALVSGTAISFDAEHEFIDSAYQYGQAVHLGSGYLLIGFYDGTYTEGKAVLVSIALDVTTFVVTGNGNIIQGNHVLGVADHQQEIAIYVDGNDNNIANNLVDGLVESDRMISGGIVIGANGNRNSLTGNRVSNCEDVGVVDGGTDTLLSGTNILYNNGADAGVEVV